MIELKDRPEPMTARQFAEMWFEDEEGDLLLIELQVRELAAMINRYFTPRITPLED